MDYLKESTDVVSSNDRKAKITLISIFLGIWMLALVVFWLLKGSEDAMGYGVVYLWVILPVTIFVLSLLVGKNNYWDKRKWWVILVSSIMYCLAEYATFSLANMVAFQKLNAPELSLLIAGALISGIGCGIGTLLNKK